MKFLTLCLTIFIITISGFATIINIPTDTNSIQDGINIAVDGDTVLVTEDRYYENINFKGKAITVASHFLIDQDTSHISKTIIDGSQPSHPDTGSVVLMISGEDSTSILCGFTITGGSGTIATGDNISYKLGGGILGYQGMRVCNNIIKNNHINAPSYCLTAEGGGIAAGGLDPSAMNIIENNEICNNSAVHYNNGAAGGIMIGGDAVIKGNNIYENDCIATEYNASGGGIFCLAWQFIPKIIISGNRICKNTVSSGKKNEYGSFGGGIHTWRHIDFPKGPQVDVYNNIIDSNKVIDSHNFGGGAGICFFELSDQSHVYNNIITNNQCIGDADFWGGGILTYGSDIKMYNNIIAFNTSMDGGGLYLSYEGDVELTNNTITENSAKKYGGGLRSLGTTIIINSILWNNSAGTSGNEIYKSAGSVNVTYSDIQGGWVGEGNIDVDPGFTTDTLFCLCDTSACIDAGNPVEEYYDLKDPQWPGFALWPAKGTIINDMGVYGGPKDVITVIDSDQKTNQFPQEFILFQNYPNPFNPSTKIEFSLPKVEHVTITVYNTLGQTIETLLDKPMPIGHHQVEFNGQHLSSSVYFYRIEAGEYLHTLKMLLVK
jgi:hypothetical protein